MALRERRAEADYQVRTGTKDLEQDYWQLQHHGLIDPDERIDLGKLTDLPGVGETTARKLKAAGIHSPHELQGKSQEEIAAIDGIGPKRAAMIRSVVDQPAPSAAPPFGHDTDPQTERSKSKIRRRSGWIGISDVPTLIPNEPDEDDIEPHAETVAVEGQDKEDAIAKHADRSTEARRADESFNARIALDYDLWSSAPNRYDYPGVDTISKTRKVERSRRQLQRAIEVGTVTDFDVSTSAISGESQTKGKYNEFIKKLEVDAMRRDSEDVLAHEVGHAADAHLGRPSSTFFSNPVIEQETKDLIEKREGGKLTDEAHAFSSERELFANLFESATIEPRATKRDAPTAYRALEDEIHGGFGPI